MRRIFIAILLLIGLYANGQRIEDSIMIPYNASGSTYPCLVYKPIGYTTSKSYPVILFGHGAGENTPPLSHIYNSTTAGGPPYFIEHAAWPDSFQNPKDGKYYQFIVVTPQAANTGWGIGANQIPYFLSYLQSHYSIDVTRIYFTGLSAGGEGEAEYLYHLGVTPTIWPAFSHLASEAGDNPSGQTWGATMAGDKDTLGGWGDTINDIHGDFTNGLIKSVNAAAPNSAKFFQVTTGGHGPWNAQYNPTYTWVWTIPGHVYTVNMYSEMLTFQRTGTTPPVANAGPDQTITLPTSAVNLDGSASTGSITSYAWSQVSGPNTASLSTPSSATTVASSLIAGIYKFQLSLNAGVSKDTVQITVQSAGTYPACGSRIKYTIASGSVGYVGGDTAFFYNAASSTTYKPGDTLVFANSGSIPRWKYIEMDNFSGNPSCPLVITYSGSQCLVENLSGDTTNGHNGTINLVSDSYLKVDGNKGTPGVYGFLIQGDPVLRYDLGAAAQVVGTSHSVEWVGTKIRNIGTGLWMKNNGDCNLIDNYPNPGVDSVFFHDNWIVGTWNEGMYIGNTSPDNAPPPGPCSYDQRPITCADTTFYPVPPRIGDIYIYNNIVDSTGRGGIQLAGASVGTSYIYNNTVMHNGMNGDDAQGTAISVGTYSRCIIHDNTCPSTYTWAIALLGASNTGFAQQIYNNTTDSSGYQHWYALATTSRAWYNPNTEPIFTDTLTWPQSVFVDTKPTCNPIDSTIVWIKNNTLKLCKRPSQQIIIQNDHSTLQLHGNNIICNNVTTGGGLAAIYLDPTASGFTYATNCSNAPCQCLTSPIKIVVH